MIRQAPPWIIGLVGLVAVLWTVPLVGVVVTSIRPPGDVALGWWSLDRVTFTLDAWRQVWADYPLLPALLTTAKLAGLATLASMLLTPAAAYAFHFLDFPFRRTLLIVIINAFVLPQQAVVIPLFQLWRETGLIDNIVSVLVPYVGLSFAWSIYLVKNYFEDFPKELIEAAKIDGCGPIAIFAHIVLPNALTPIVAVGILQFLWCWNSLFLPMLFLRTNVPLPVLLAQLAGAHDLAWDKRSVAAIVTTIVPLAVFLVFQGRFAAGAQVRSGAKE